jgi:hypothetical protein
MRDFLVVGFPEKGQRISFPKIPESCFKKRKESRLGAGVMRMVSVMTGR